MSSRMVGMVFERYPSGGGEFALALALADHAHDDGTHIFAYVSTLAEKSRQSVRTVQRQLDRMLRVGFLVRVDEGHGGRGRAARYRISPHWIGGGELLPDDLGKGDNLAPFSDSESVDNCETHKAERVTSGAQKGDIAVSPAKEPYEPNTNTFPPTPLAGAEPGLRPSGLRKADGGDGVDGGEGGALLSFGEWLGQVEARGDPPIPPGHAVLAYAQGAGVGPRLLALAWAEWSHHRSKEAKRQRDWPGRFERAVRGNLLRLWFIPAGSTRAELTTQGRQAEAVHGAVPLLGGGADATVAPKSANDELARLASERAEYQANRERNESARRAVMAKMQARKASGQEH